MMFAAVLQDRNDFFVHGECSRNDDIVGIALLGRKVA